MHCVALGRGIRKLGSALLLVLLPMSFAHADRLVFGSFRSAENAANWAQRLTTSLGAEIEDVSLYVESATWYRVQSSELQEPELSTLMRRASTAGVEFWRLRSDGVTDQAVSPGPFVESRLRPPARVSELPAQVPDAKPSVAKQPPSVEPATVSSQQQFDLEIGLTSRFFPERGLQGQRRIDGSIGILPEYYVAWENDRKSFTFSPFLRVDSNDSERTHFDVREMFYSYVGNSWDIHVGVKKVFWGVTEFHHLVDVINQTDLVENIDGEDKLGQPMVQFSWVNDWGIVDVYALTGFRERTFAGDDGRLTLPLPIRSDARYESRAEDYRTDFAVRWSHHVGIFEFGLHHFSGTSREPMFDLIGGGGQLSLQAYYPVIDQSGFDAQAIVGDWALKFEGISRSGFGDRYAAVNAGVEKTLVGVFDSHADLGVVLEYMYDERGEDAFNTMFESDVALGGRLALNDFANTQALLGVIYDTQRSNYTVSLEASRQLSDSWHLNVEGRLFGGGKQVSDYNSILVLTDPDYKHAWLDSEDYLQIEVKKFF